MNGQPSGKVRSTIVKVPDASPGLLFLNGEQKAFSLEGLWKSPVAPAPNMTVDVDLDDAGTITAITVVDSHQLAKERMNQLSGVAQERGKEAAKLAQQGIGALAGRMGAVALGSAVLVWIAWFFLPAAHLEAGAQLSFSFWDLLGVDFNNPETLAAGSSSHGLLSIIGLIAIAAPFAAPFIRAAWSKYLNAAPLAFVVIGLITIFSSEHSAFGQVAQLVGENPFSWSAMLIVLLLASVVLATGSLKKAPATA
jgi:cation transport ATPase